MTETRWLVLAAFFCVVMALGITRCNERFELTMAGEK